MSNSTRILIFTGEGKGKTTAALGMALRASGHGLRCCVIQFVKGDASVGEVAALAGTTHIELRQTGLGFIPPAASPQFGAHQVAAEAGLQLAREILASGRYWLVVLDEICVAVSRGLLSEQAVLATLASAAPDSCVVLTGRGATAGLLAAADTVTEMRCVKHALQAGRPAERGVER